MLADKRTVIDGRQGGLGRSGVESPSQALGGEELTWNGREPVQPWQRGHGDKVIRMRSCLQHVKNDKQFGIAGAWLWPWGVPRAHRPSPDCGAALGIQELGTVAPSALPRPPPSASHPQGWELLPRQGGLCPSHPVSTEEERRVSSASQGPELMHPASPTPNTAPQASKGTGRADSPGQGPGGHSVEEQQEAI